MRPGPRRIARAVLLVAGSLATGSIVAVLVGPDRFFGLSMATGYVGLGLLALSLLPGPLALLRGRSHPVSSHLRRDVGIAGGVVSLIHVGVGIQRHMSGRWWLYFVSPNGEGWLRSPRIDPFGAANWVGLGGTVLIIVLLALSSDRALRALGSRRWKALQRWNYPLFAAVTVHAVAYQAMGDRLSGGWGMLTAAVVLTVIGIQLAGVRAYRTLRSDPAGPVTPPRR